MKRLVFFLLLIIPRILCAQTCGEERWPVKTLADAQAAEAVASPIKNMLISDLANMEPRPRGILNVRQNRRFPEEMIHLRVNALLVGFKKESDEDFHIVLADPDNPKVTMIAEIPNAECAPKEYKELFTDLQSQFVVMFGKATAKFKKLRPAVPVIVEGILFRDFLHGQTGVAPSGTEIHPILAFQKQGSYSAEVVHLANAKLKRIHRP